MRPRVLALVGSCLLFQLFAACGDNSPSNVDAEGASPTRGPVLPDAGDSSSAVSSDAASDAGTCGANTASDVQNCGTCGHVCPAGAKAAASCIEGKCGLACPAGYADCDGDAANGCEVFVDTDLMNCGACGHACGACDTGSTCKKGICDASTVTLGQAGGQNIVADAQNLYWTVGGANAAVRQIAKSGAGGVKVLASASNTSELAVTATGSVFYENNGLWSTFYNQVCPCIPSFGTMGKEIGGIGFDAPTGVYWGEQQDGGTWQLKRYFSAAPSVVASGEPGVTHVAIDATTVFYFAADVLRRVEKVGGAPQSLAVGQDALSTIAADGQYVYWANGGRLVFNGPATPGTLQRLAKSGGGTPIPLATGLHRPYGIVVTGDHLYLSERGDPDAPNGALTRMKPDGAERVTLAAGLVNSGGVAVDDRCAYFFDGAALRKVAR